MRSARSASRSRERVRADHRAKRGRAVPRRRPVSRRVAAVLQRPPTEREVVAGRIAARLDQPVAILGLVALTVWLAEPLIGADRLVTRGLTATWFLIWILFAAE